MRVGRNNLCFCGSGKKYKKCCLSLGFNSKQLIPVLPQVEDECDTALAKFEDGDLIGAKAEAERLYALFPGHHMVNFLKGVSAIQNESYQEAILFFEEAIRINPLFCEAYFNLAGAYQQEMKMPRFIACMKKILEIEGEHGDIGKLAKEKIDWFRCVLQDTSGETLEDYLKSSTFFDEAFDNLKQGHYKEAITLFQQVLVLNPRHVQSYGNMALAYSALGEQAVAHQYLDKALLLDPTYEPAQQNKKSISRLKEGEKIPFAIRDTFYYKEKLESEGIKAKPLRKLSWSAQVSAYVTKLIDFVHN